MEARTETVARAGAAAGTSFAHGGGDFAHRMGCPVHRGTVVGFSRLSCIACPLARTQSDTGAACWGAARNRPNHSSTDCLGLQEMAAFSTLGVRVPAGFLAHPEQTLYGVGYVA